MRILAIDLGLKRTGLAVCDAGEVLASPLGTVTEADPTKLLARIVQTAREQEAELLLVGLPKNMDGSCGESARRSQIFAERLKESTRLPVQLWDERMTTMTAIQYLNTTNVRGKSAGRWWIR